MKIVAAMIEANSATSEMNRKMPQIVKTALFVPVRP
jgi:hypothetical protein